MITALRLVIGFLFFCHGTSTLFAWFATPYGGDPAPVGSWPAWWMGLIQTVAGLLIVVGWGTRTAAFIGSGAMAVAYFWMHQGDGLLPIQNDGDSAALFAWTLLLLVFTGPGSLALCNVTRTQRTDVPPCPSATMSPAS